jgi:autotransporter-associated beta strand protein
VGAAAAWAETAQAHCQPAVAAGMAAVVAALAATRSVEVFPPARAAQALSTAFRAVELGEIKRPAARVARRAAVAAVADWRLPVAAEAVAAAESVARTQITRRKPAAMVALAAAVAAASLPAARAVSAAAVAEPAGPAALAAVAAQAEQGASAPARDIPARVLAAGGGLGAGGDIFVQAGASLTINGAGTLSGTATGGSGGGSAGSGSGYGSGIFLNGDQSLTFSPGIGQTQTVSGVIADMTGSGASGVGTIIIDGLGIVVLSGSNSFTGGIHLNSGTLVLTNANSAGFGSGGTGAGTITFGTSIIDPTIIIDVGDTPGAGGTFANTLDRFGDNDNLDIKGLNFTSGATAILTGGDLAITSDSETIHFTLTNPGASTFYVYDDGTGHVLVNDDPACYCRGTRIMTDDGPVPVEDLKIGDRLVTFDGKAMPLKWIGRRSYLDWAAVGNQDVQPILFRAGALADSVPSRDLMVSPEHAMFLDGVLIPARHLVNGVSISQMKALDEIHYFHLELERHAVIFAEDAASESFVDDDSRGMFHNVYEFHALYPDAPRGGPAEYCAPRVEDGFILEGVRRALAARAAWLMPDGTAAPAPALVGYLDCVTRTSVEGWAFDPQTPDRPVRLAILADGAVIGRVVADIHRSDLANAGIGSGRHAYRFELPLGFVPDVSHMVEVRRESDWGSLIDSPAILEAGARYASSRVTSKKPGRGRVDSRQSVAN